MSKPVWTTDQVVAQLTNWGARWDNSSPVPFMFYAQSAEHHLYKPSFGAFSEAERQSLLRSMQLVSDVAKISFVNIPPGTQAPSKANPFLGFYTINDSSAPFWGTATGYASEGDTPDPSGELYGADVLVNRNQSNNSGWGFGTVNSEAMLHELLHGIGLDHAGDWGNQGPFDYENQASYYQDSVQYTVMSYWPAFNTGADHVAAVLQLASTPLLYDVAALQALYGANMSTRTGNTVYGFNNNSGRDAFDLAKNPGAVFTIWDAGGIDTLDLSGYSTASRVDLREGAFSDAGGMTLNISIARGATIENAIGGAGDDALTGNQAANRLTGGGGNDTLDGREADDILDGGAGSDTMTGGAGSDTYSVDNAGDKSVETSATGGTDTVRSSICYTLGNHVERLVLTGNASTKGTGNNLGNTLTGNAGANALDGGAGNDLLDGGAGGDTMTGGSGDDSFVVDNAGDKVVEAAGAGTDTVRSAISYVLVANVEKLVLTGTGANSGTGNGLANLLTGNAASNFLNGGAGADTMIGGAGDDIYVVDNLRDVVTELADGGTDRVQSSISFILPAGQIENLTLTGSAAIAGTGNARANSLVGNAAANRLDGAAGADRMSGGGGNDLYLVDNAGDKVVESSGSGGVDTVRSLVSHALAVNVENLVLGGSAAINGVGNELANALTGNAAKNVLNGGAGNDLIDGGAGADTMAGASGDDIYLVDDSGDSVTEASAAGGLDTVRSAIAFRLPDHVEKLVLTGGALIGGIGNALDNMLTGNAAANVLSGGAGNDRIDGGAGNDRLMGNSGADRLTGGAGYDEFVFSSAPSSSNADTIIDYYVPSDSIFLSRSAFAAAGPNGRLGAAAFHQGTAAADAGDRIIYDRATGKIFYDPDGTGGAAQILFATVSAGTAITNSEFTIYG